MRISDWSSDVCSSDLDNIYLNLGAGYGIPNTPVTLTAGIGYNDGSLGLVSPDGQYLDWSVGASFAAGPLTLSAQYIDTDVKKTGVKAVDTLYDPTVVLDRKSTRLNSSH